MLSTSDSESDIEVPLSKKRKWAVRKDYLYKRNIIKQSRLSGNAYVNYKGQPAPGKSLGQICGCHQDCLNKTLTKEAQLEMFDEFYKIETKNQQDSHLQGLMEIKPIEQKRARPGTCAEKAKGKKHTISYFFSSKGKRIQVCKKAILTLYSISEKRLRRISGLLAVGKSPKDNRGKTPKTHVIPGEICQEIRDHLESFPKKTSHYTGKPVIYLSADLNIKIMYEMFKKKHPDSKVKYSFYYTFYKENFNYRFGRPQKDVCGTCEELTTKIKSNTLNENAKRAAVAEKMVHLNRAKKFYSALKVITKKCEDNPEVYGVTVDYMQNLPLPHIPVQEIFYYRQLWVNCFCVYDLKTKISKLYLYHEGIAKKGGNEVSSFLFDYIQKNIPESAKEIHVFSDGCTGQNRNHTVLRALLGLSAARKTLIKQYFPVRGHSFLPCDRTFGVVKRAIKKADRVYTPFEYKTLIDQSSVKIETELLEDSDIIFNFDEWWPNYFKKYVSSTESLAKTKDDRQEAKKSNQKVTPGVARSKLRKFKISEFYFFEMEQCVIKASTTINGLDKNTFKLKKPEIKNIEDITLPKQRAYISKNPINIKKINDILKVVKYVPEEHKLFYDLITTSWPTTTLDNDDGQQ